MPSLTPKQIGGHTYYYARYCQRVDGKPKIVRQVYLGKIGFLAVWHGLRSRYWSAFTNHLPCAAGYRGCGKVGILLLDFRFSTAPRLS